MMEKGLAQKKKKDAALKGRLYKGKKGRNLKSLGK